MGIDAPRMVAGVLAGLDGEHTNGLHDGWSLPTEVAGKADDDHALIGAADELQFRVHAAGLALGASLCTASPYKTG